MATRAHLVRAAIGAAALLASTIAGTVSASASSSPRTYLIGVDAAGPAGHDFEYVDYFPRGQVGNKGQPAVVGNGAILHFKYNLASLDGLHTATLLPASETPSQAWANHPLVTLDEPEPAPKPMLNPDALFARPAGCGGSAANPCVYTGAGEVNSGAMPAFAAPDYYVQISLSADSSNGDGAQAGTQQGQGQGDHQDGTTVHYVCLIHPGMEGSITVVDGRGSSPAAFARAAKAQLKTDTAQALKKEAQANHTLVTSNGDGTSTITMVAGTATPFVEIVEMLPQHVTVHPGDKVKWVTTTLKDPHTVTFPDTGTGPSLVEPLGPPYAPPPECEGNPDTAPPCATPEIPINPAPNGVTTITSPATVATSGIIAPFPPFQNNFTFSFPNPGVFAYQCRIHDHMNGTITVSS
jgi:plastocyanin